EPPSSAGCAPVAGARPTYFDGPTRRARLDITASRAFLVFRHTLTQISHLGFRPEGEPEGQRKQKPPEKSLRPIEEIARDPWFSRLIAAGRKLSPKNSSLRRGSSRCFRHL